jgi:hypothetical protein
VKTESPDSTPPRGEQPAGLPVRQAELGLVEGELPVDPAGEPIAHERGVDGGVEPFLLVGILADQRRGQARAVPIEQVDRLGDRVDLDQPVLRSVLPLPLVTQPIALGRRDAVDHGLGTTPSRRTTRRVDDEVGELRRV